MNLFIGVILCIAVVAKAVDESSVPIIRADEVIENWRIENECHHENMQTGDFFSQSCIPQKCGRRVVDGVFSDADIAKLHSIVKKGMAHREEFGGPTILDINTGYIRDTKGLDNLFAQPNDYYTEEEFAHYGKIIQKLKETVQETFDAQDVHFTAPTFITRLDGTKDWQPEGAHDEYWHPHADMNNTAHYHYSGLLYMSTYGQDFTGGRFKFLNYNTPLPSYTEDHKVVYPDESEYLETIVEPRAGRTVIFTAGPENPHYVERVLSGQRFVLSFWFTCDEHKQFDIFLDGKQHIEFSRKMGESHKYHVEQDRKNGGRKRKPVPPRREL